MSSSSNGRQARRLIEWHPKTIAAMPANEMEGWIDELKSRAEKVAGGTTLAWESDTLSAEARAQFWEHAVDYAAAPSTTDFQRLTDNGLEMPEAGVMDDERLSVKLWEIIHALAEMRVFISHTDHLSQRELYTTLWRDVLRVETPSLPVDSRAATFVDLLGGWSEADTYLYMKYYADEESRRQWLVDFPDYEMPAHDDPPYDRDRLLPQPWEV